MFLNLPPKAARLKSFMVPLPAPVGGWNASDSLTSMKSDQAVLLDNYFPEAEKVTLRRGYTSHATGMTGVVDSLLVYSPTTGSQKMFAANNKKIYDVTSAGGVGAAAVSSLTNNRWQYVNYGTAGGQFLFACNGEDTPITYDGSSWGTTSLTGPTVTKLIWCHAHQNRLWTGESASLAAYYGGTNAITGTFTAFNFYSVAQLGGYIMGMATWTRDGGSGSDDVAVFATSEGEYILYSGTDPSDATKWSLVGVFRLGKPIGRRFALKAGGDLILVTEDGFVSLSSILQVDRSQAQNTAISSQINKAVNDVVRTASGNFGWQPVLYPRGTMFFVNIPISSTISHQYVFNTLTKKPCRFRNMNANCWALCNDTLYFGGKSGIVYKADYGFTDNGANIVGDIFPAFNYFGDKSVIKSFGMCQLIWEGDQEIVPSLHLNVDFQRPETATATSSLLSTSAGTWDTSLWDQGIWGGDNEIFANWGSVTGIGRAASLRALTSTATTRPSLVAINYIFQKGGYL